MKKPDRAVLHSVLEYVTCLVPKYCFFCYTSNWLFV